jgi:hypothetical protein
MNRDDFNRRYATVEKNMIQYCSEGSLVGAQVCVAQAILLLAASVFQNTLECRLEGVYEDKK